MGHDSVLGPLLFVMYNTPLSTLIFSLSLNRPNSSKTEFLLIGFTKQLAKILNSSLNTTHSARNLGFIFDEHLTFSDQISSVSKSFYNHIRQLRCIRPYLDSKTASTVVTSIVQSKLDYYNSLCHNLPVSNSSHPTNPELSFSCCCQSYLTPILRSLHWLRITERIEYKRLSLTYKVLTTTQPSYLHNLISLQSTRSTRSSALVTLTRPHTSSSLRITDRSFQYASPRLWNHAAPGYSPTTSHHPI